MMKKRYGRTSFLITGLAALAVFLCGGSSAAASQPDSAGMEPGNVRVTVEYIRVYDKYIEVDAAYPIVSGMRDVAFQAEFNRQTQADIRNLAVQYQSEAREEASKGYGFHRYAFNSAVGEYLNNGRLLSVAIRMDIYTGGAHPFGDSRFYALENSLPARRLTLPDLFADPAAGMSVLNEAVHKQIAAHPGEYFDAPEAAVDAQTWFYLMEKELHIVFPAYSIAPGAAGEPDFAIPLAALRELLVPGVF